VCAARQFFSTRYPSAPLGNVRALFLDCWVCLFFQSPHSANQMSPAGAFFSESRAPPIMSYRARLCFPRYPWSPSLFVVVVVESFVAKQLTSSFDSKPFLVLFEEPLRAFPFPFHPSGAHWWTPYLLDGALLETHPICAAPFPFFFLFFTLGRELPRRTAPGPFFSVATRCTREPPKPRQCRSR